LIVSKIENEISRMKVSEKKVRENCTITRVVQKKNASSSMIKVVSPIVATKNFSAF